MRKTLLFLSSLSFSLLHAGGFQVNTQGIKQMGMGHTGTGLLLDASTLFFNPGGTSFLQTGWSFVGGTTLLFPRTVYAEPAPGTYTAEMVHHVDTPFNFYASWHCKKDSSLAAGIAVYTPFGSLAQWPDDWKGQFIVRAIDLKTIFIQPTVSYKINDHIGIGAGFVYATGSFMLRQGIPVQDTLGNYGEAKLEGAAGGYGYNAGIYLKLNDTWSAGISYRSTVKTKVKSGTANFTVPSSLAEYFPATTFTTTLVLPQVINFGVGYSSGKWKLAADVNYVGWHTYDTLRINFADHTDKLQDIHSPRCYKDAVISRVGAQFHLDDHFDLRAGAYYDLSPAKAGYLTPETPDSDRLGITCGTTIHFSQKLCCDISLLYIEGMKRTDTNLETGFSGTYKSRLFSPGIGAAYSF